MHVNKHLNGNAPLTRKQTLLFHLVDLNRPFVTLLSYLSEYLEELKQYGPAYTQWAELEDALEEPLRGVASCVERCGKETEEHVQHLSDVLVPALHEYVLCAETVKVDHLLLSFLSAVFIFFLDLAFDC